ncbi:hypothetical protein Pmani_038297, partial [Petrolisthes manimaculis]
MINPVLSSFFFLDSQIGTWTDTDGFETVPVKYTSLVRDRGVANRTYVVTSIL